VHDASAWAALEDKAEADKLKGPPRPLFWSLWEVAVGCLMLAATVLLFIYMFQLNNRLRLASR
jgi:hypothetical protein